MIEDDESDDADGEEAVVRVPQKTVTRPLKKRPKHLRVEQLTPTKAASTPAKPNSPPVDAYIPDSPPTPGPSDMSAPSTPGSPPAPMIGPMQLPPGHQGAYAARQLFEGERVGARVEANNDGVAVEVRADRARLEAGKQHSLS